MVLAVRILLLSLAVALSASVTASALEPLPKRLVDQGYKQLCDGQYTLAVKTLSAALQADPRSIPAQRYLGYALLRQGQSARAVSQFEALTRTGKADAEDHAGLADALRYAGRRAAAVAEYEQALKLSPGLEVAYDGLIRCRMEMGQLSLAAAACLEAAKGARNESTKVYFLTLLDEIESIRSGPAAQEGERSAAGPG
ncbi:MAG TPA: tetratricopeptide repeat protein [Candidatus Obscuribacterales bacterium]